MANGDDSWIHIVHTLWSAALTALLGLAGWNWKSLTDRVESKADRTELDTLREDLASWKGDQQTQHKENRDRLDNIYKLLVTLNGDSGH
jgi:hypothetical protein